MPDIVANDIRVSVVGSYFFFLIPQILYWITPLAVLVAVLVNLGTLTKTNETLAVKAGAISLYRMAVPLVLTAMLLSAGIYAMQDFVLHTRISVRMSSGTGSRDGQRRPTATLYGKWMAGSENHIYYYTYFNPDQNAFPGISVFEFDPTTFALRRWTFAQQANWNGQSWAFQDGWTRSIDSGGEIAYDAFERLDYLQMKDGPTTLRKKSSRPRR